MIGSFICVTIGHTNSLHSPCMVEKHNPRRRGFIGKQWDAQWDTGATCSVITPGIIRYLNAAPVSYVIVSGVNGIERAAQYYVDFGLPGGVIAEKVLVVEGTPIGCDLLIGMDIIALGDFISAYCNGTTHFGFRTPSELPKDDISGLFGVTEK